jgi:hypothetical protein
MEVVKLHLKAEEHLITNPTTNPETLMPECDMLSIPNNRSKAESVNSLIPTTLISTHRMLLLYKGTWKPALPFSSKQCHCV